MSLDESTIVTRSRELTATELDAELVMLDFERGRYFGLNEVGATIWRHLEHPLSVARLQELLEAEFDVDRETCRDEVGRFLGELERAGLLLRSEP